MVKQKFKGQEEKMDELGFLKEIASCHDNCSICRHQIRKRIKRLEGKKNGRRNL